MGDHHQLKNQSGGGANGDRVDAGAVAAEPVRTRWTPKPEQILILESIFNSGMVNPPKDETVRIRKLLEKFGSVGDANVFYWFQNRRSRSRRRQRQMLQAAAGVVDPRNSTNNHHELYSSSTTTAGIIPSGAGAGAISSNSSSSTTTCWSSVNCSCGPVGFEYNYSQYDPTMTSNYNASSAACSTSFCTTPGSLLDLQPDHDDDDDDAEDLFSISRQMRNINNRENCSSSTIITDDQTPTMYAPALMSAGHCSTGAASLCFPSGLITVFINGSLQEVPRGPFDVRAVFGQDVMLLHSSGELLPMNDYGILFHGLFPGESYFLVPRSM